MRIVIDLQGAQSSGSRNRGIGRYTLSLSKAIVRNRGKHEVILALNGLFPETIEPIRADFDDLLPQKNICVWHAPGSVSSVSPENDWRRKTAELVREAFIASLKPEIVLVTSLFEGLLDDAVTSIGALSLNVPTATILYDVIPFIYRHTYMRNPVVEAWYEAKLDHLRRSDLLLAISESSRQDGIRYWGFPEDATFNISTAADSQFQSQSIASKQEAEIRERYNLQRPYVMYTGGIDYRKNIEGLIRAYASLPEKLRAQHQLVVVCAIQPHDKSRLEHMAKKQGLSKDELVLTGFVPEDDLLALYNLCKLFVFPSWYEGFGLPALEAMLCGRAVIGANTSSVPEVIGREDALFDPRSDEAIAAKLKEVLTDDAFRLELERYGPEQANKFSWDKSAARAIAALEKFIEPQRGIAIEPSPVRRLKMAYISPLPPERSGISDYSAELLPELSRHYDIDIIVAQNSISDPWINANCHIKSVEWFQSHADRYDRVLYQFGNSHFHQHMISLLEEIPGVVVLHDFFLSGMVAHMDIHELTPNGWANELYCAHGYKAAQERFHATDTADVILKYPCNLGVLRNAQGVIVHSENSRRLAKHWYATADSDHWVVIPLLRSPALERDRTKARYALSLGADDFVICSFGFLDRTKLNHRLLKAWLTSDLAKDKNCVLVFVGYNQEDNYCQELLTTIQRSGVTNRIRITGWLDSENYRHYLAAADIGIQLRTLSRGETSAAVLNCMNYGIPTIVNVNAGMADLPDDAVWKLPDEFSNDQLIEALETLWRDAHRREQLGERAREIILSHHAPRACADQYFAAIENFHRSSATDIRALTHTMAQVEPKPSNPKALLPLAEAVAKSIPPSFTPRKLLVDVSGLVQGDSEYNDQRVVQSVLRELLNNPPDGLRVEPVYASIEHGYRYARCFTLEFMGLHEWHLRDDPVEYRSDDIFLGLDFQPHIINAHQAFYQQMRQQGVQVRFAVYDFSFPLMPQHFVEGTAEELGQWLEIVAESDGAVCISKAVADELTVWIKEYGPERLRPFNISRFPFRADIEENRMTKTSSFKGPDGSNYYLSIPQIKGDPFLATVENNGGQNENLKILWSFLNKEDTFFDLGANIGTISIPLAVKGVRVYAFEILKENIQALVSSKESNHLPNINIIEGAVWENDGEVGIGGHSAWGHVAVSYNTDKTIQSFCLDTFISKHEISRVNAIKIDIEGSEIFALRGAANLLKRDSPMVLFESNVVTCGNSGYSFREIVRFFENLEYNVFRIDGNVLAPFNSSGFQEIVFCDYLAFKGYLPENIASAGFQVRDMNESEIIRNIELNDQMPDLHKQYILTVIDQGPIYIKNNVKITKLLDKWKNLVMDESAIEVLRIGSK